MKQKQLDSKKYYSIADKYSFWDNSKTETITIRLTKFQKKIIKELSLDYDLTQTQFILNLLEDHYRKSMGLDD